MSFNRPTKWLLTLLASIGILAASTVATASAQGPIGTTTTTVVRGGQSITTTILDEDIAPDGRPMRAGSLLVRFQEGASQAERDEAHQRARAALAEALLDPDLLRVEVPRDFVAQALEAYRLFPAVLRADADYIARATFTPNDPRFGEQWGMVKIKAGAPASAPATSAWDISTSSFATRIGVLDCGVYSDTSSTFKAPDGFVGHPDLRNGKVVANQNFTTAANADDFCNHGTHVAGIAAANTNNSIGVAGAGYDARIVNVKVLGDNGSGSFAWIINGILWAAGCDTDPCGPRRAEVINMSLGAAGACPADMQAAIDKAWAKGLVIAAAAGNDGTSGASTPGNCNHVLAVAASDQNDLKATFSNFGPNVDVAAPGVAILSSNYLGTYSSFDGTSMASPHVAGLAGLLWPTSHNTGNQAVVDRIQCTADHTASAGSSEGRIDALAAVRPGPCGLPVLSIADASAPEGDLDSSTVTFAVTFSPASADPVTVDYGTADGTATAGTDYVPAAGVLTFAPGETSKPIDVSIIGDTLLEPHETFTVTLSNPINAAVGDGQAVGTILNDEVPAISIGDTSLNEGDKAPSSATFAVTLSGAGTSPVTADWATADGTATAGSDYTAASGTLTFNPGETSQSIVVTVTLDITVEPDETFLVNLTNVTNATVADGQGQGTIVNDDVLALSINDVTVAEGNTGATNAVFTVSLNGTSSLPVTVNFATADGTATTTDSDYTAASGTLTFNPGESSKDVLVPVLGDTQAEPNETFVVNLSGATNAAIADGQGQGTITNDDAPPGPTLSINDVSRAEGRRTRTTPFTFTVTVSASSSQTVTAAYATANGTATGGSTCASSVDYRTLSGSLTFSPGQTSKAITVQVCGDNNAEPNETFFVNLSNPTGGATIANGQGQGTILNDD